MNTQVEVLAHMSKHSEAANIVAEIVQLYKMTLSPDAQGKDVKLASYLHVQCCLLLQANRDKRIAVNCYNQSKAIMDSVSG